MKVCRHAAVQNTFALASSRGHVLPEYANPRPPVCTVAHDSLPIGVAALRATAQTEIGG
jgi:hypothetical protein